MALKRALALPDKRREEDDEAEWRRKEMWGDCRTFERDACVFRALNAFFDNAELRLRQLLAENGKSALVLLVDGQTLPRLEAKGDNLGLHSFDGSAEFVVIFDSLQVRDGRPAGFHLMAKSLKRLEELFGRELVAALLNLGLKGGELLREMTLRRADKRRGRADLSRQVEEVGHSRDHVLSLRKRRGVTRLNVKGG